MQIIKKYKKTLIYLIIFVLMITYSIYWAFFSMERLPKGDLILQTSSPNKTFEIRAYLINGGATTSYAIRAELIKPSGHSKNIYWNYREERAEIVWLSEDRVEINGHILNLPNEKYDFRRKN